MKNTIFYSTQFLFLLFIQTAKGQTTKIQNRKEISQYGITWTFDKPAKTGQFITGDWWVIGPVTIVKISPAPGPTHPENFNISINKWNDTSLKLDTTMRNGSMIVLPRFLCVAYSTVYSK